MLNGPNLENPGADSIDPCCVLTKGTLARHCLSVNIRMQLNLKHLPSSFGFLCSGASRCRVLVLGSCYVGLDQ